MQYAISPETHIGMDDLNAMIYQAENEDSTDAEKLDAMYKVRELSGKIDVYKVLNKELDMSPLKVLDWHDDC